MHNEPSMKTLARDWRLWLIVGALLLLAGDLASIQALPFAGRLALLEAGILAFERLLVRRKPELFTLVD